VNQRKFRRFSVLIAIFLVAAPLARAVTMIFPVDAIADLWNLAADEFRQKYAGINVTGLGPSDEGWYVRYRHENLTYLFGPLAECSYMNCKSKSCKRWMEKNYMSRRNKS
jgi:hypothetical protein